MIAAIESITSSQKNSVFHEGFDSIIFERVKVLRSAYTLHEFLRVAIVKKTVYSMKDLIP